MGDAHLHRREKLRARLRESDADAFLVTLPANLRYLTGFTGEAAALIVTHTRDVIVSDGRFVAQLGEECPGLELAIRPVAELIWPTVADTLRKLGAKRATFEAAGITVAEFEMLTSAAGTIALAACRGWVEEARAIKDDEELRLIKAAIRAAESAFLEFLGLLKSDETEKGAADLLEFAIRRAGANSSSFDPIVAAGHHSAKPHARPRNDTRVLDSEFVLVDWGAKYRGYGCDLTRMILTGKVTSQFSLIYQTVLAAEQRAISLIRPGAKAFEVDDGARAVISEAGFGSFFNHGLGHGLGLEIHEAPSIRKASAAVFQPGMVITIEPGIYLPEWGGVRIEDDLVVTPDGVEMLTSLASEIDAVPRVGERTRSGIAHTE